ncbi:MAG TPA: YbjQ family protein [Gemmatimonadales bacterium]|nr:YbjQ family protein [Gemmatimonadales bacterium]
MDETMTSTTFTLDGFQIVQSLGVVRGVTVRSRSLIGTIGAKVETMFGGHISMLTTLCERARSDAFDILLAHAQRRGANAVVGVRYDATEIMSGVTEVICYGTAVVVEPLDLQRSLQ